MVVEVWLLAVLHVKVEAMFWGNSTVLVVVAVMVIGVFWSFVTMKLKVHCVGVALSLTGIWNPFMWLDRIVPLVNQSVKPLLGE